MHEIVREPRDVSSISSVRGWISDVFPRKLADGSGIRDTPLGSKFVAVPIDRLEEPLLKLDL